METTIVYWAYIWVYIGIIENEIETTVAALFLTFQDQSLPLYSDWCAQRMCLATGPLLSPTILAKRY